jgi:REP element-mobilizing transposase RayT
MNEQDPIRKEPKEGLGAAEKSSAGVPPAGLSRGGDVSIRNRGHLPHWEAAAATYFVTFRLADSLPHEALREILFARKGIPATAALMGRTISEAERKRLLKLHSPRIEQYLNAGAGACFLGNEDLAKVVADSLRQFDGARYRLFAWCVMPNHVHVVFQALAGNSLARILHSWKSFSAKQANRILHRSAEFWQREYYDRLVRDTSEFHRALQYVVDNPKRAGLKDWAWVWPKEEVGVGLLPAHQFAPKPAGGTPALRKPIVEEK